jgi:hypothetical protein
MTVTSIKNTLKDVVFLEREHIVATVRHGDSISLLLETGHVMARVPRTPVLGCEAFCLYPWFCSCVPPSDTEKSLKEPFKLVSLICSN